MRARPSASARSPFPCSACGCSSRTREREGSRLACCCLLAWDCCVRSASTGEGRSHGVGPSRSERPGFARRRTLRAALGGSDGKWTVARHATCAWKGYARPLAARWRSLMRALFRPSSCRSSLLESRAREMRHQPTASEEALWRALSARKLGVAFRRQVPLLGRYVADFYASEARLVVEIDGAYHGRRVGADARRGRALQRAGYRVVRVSVELVLADMAGAVARVRVALRAQ